MLEQILLRRILVEERVIANRQDLIILSDTKNVSVDCLLLRGDNRKRTCGVWRDSTHSVQRGHNPLI
jgi:hypothetical protein